MRSFLDVAQVFTVGHGTRSAREFVTVLTNARIDVVVDVRRFPGSRRHPQFGHDALEATLSEAEIDYEWRGEALGGRRRAAPDSPNIAWRVDGFRGYADHMASPEFQAALAELESVAEAKRQAVMCAETLWWRCHRRLIADALVARGHEVIHLGLGKDEPHRLHPNARVDERRTVVYDAGLTPQLDL